MKQMEEKAAMPIQPMSFVAFLLQIKQGGHYGETNKRRGNLLPCGLPCKAGI